MRCAAHPLEEPGDGKVRGVPQALIVHVQGWAAHVIRVRAFGSLPVHGQVAGIRIPCTMAQQRHTHSQASTISITGSHHARIASIMAIHTAGPAISFGQNRYQLRI